MPGRLIFFALPGEASAFFKRAAAGGMPFTRNPQVPPGVARRTQGEDEVWVTGVGRANARRVGMIALEACRPELVLTCGVAGALNPAHEVGAVFHQADAYGQLSHQLHEAGSRPGEIITRDFVAVTRQQKAALFAEAQADLVEMESDVLRSLAAERGIKSATVRSVSDTANADLPLDFNKVYSTDMRLDPFKLGMQIAGAPWKIPALMRLGRDAAAASASLADVLFLSLYCDTDKR